MRIRQWVCSAIARQGRFAFLRGHDLVHHGVSHKVHQVHTMMYYGIYGYRWIHSLQSQQYPRLEGQHRQATCLPYPCQAWFGGIQGSHHKMELPYILWEGNSTIHGSFEQKLPIYELEGALCFPEDSQVTGHLKCFCAVLIIESDQLTFLFWTVAGLLPVMSVTDSTAARQLIQVNPACWVWSLLRAWM